MPTKALQKRKYTKHTEIPVTIPALRKPPQPEIIQAAAAPPQEFELTQQPLRKFKDAYKTACPGCRSALMLSLPAVHCPACHKIWRSKKLSSPTRCPQCNFSLWRWRLENNIKDHSAQNALVA